MTRALALASLAVACLSLAGCGGDGGARAVLADTSANLGEIRSGTLDMALVVEPRDGEPFGFELAGPFELRGDGELPVMRLEYTRIAEGQRATVTMVSDGEAVHAEADGSRIELTPEQVEELRSAAGSLTGGDGSSALEIGDWFETAERSSGGEGLDKVEGELDIVAAVNGLAGLSGIDPVEGEDAERLRDATESARYAVHTGGEDRLLRRLEMEADFGFDVSEELREQLGEIVGAKVTFRLGITDPNQRQ